MPQHCWSLFCSSLVASRSAFGSPDFIHFRDSLLELFVLTFLVTVSLFLEHMIGQPVWTCADLSLEAHLALPW